MKGEKKRDTRSHVALIRKARGMALGMHGVRTITAARSGNKPGMKAIPRAVAAAVVAAAAVAVAVVVAAAAAAVVAAAVVHAAAAAVVVHAAAAAVAGTDACDAVVA
jgi:hypothetical protein